MNRLRTILSLCAVLSCGACLPIFKKLTAPKADPDKLEFRKKYCSTSQRPQPRQGTTLYSLHIENKCGPGMTSCQLGLDAATGKLPSEYTELFADLLHSKPRELGGPDFTYDTCDITTRTKPYLLGIDGIGLSHSAKHQELLSRFVSQYGELNFNDSSTQRRLVRALFLTGKSDAAEGSLRAMLDMQPEADWFKDQILKYLATWESTAAVDFCMDTLRGGKGPKEACIWYLGRMRHGEAYEFIVRRMEDEPEAAVRALGQLGDPRAVGVLEQTLAASRSLPLRTRSLVALMNLGKHELYPEFERLLRGRTLLSSGAETSRAKVGVMERAMFEALHLTDPGLRAKVLEHVTGSAEVDEKTSNAWRVPVFTKVVRVGLGDTAATEGLVSLLDDPRKDVRHLVVRMVGANFDQLDGTRIVDPALLPPLVRTYEMEPGVSAKHNIVLAAAYLSAE